jgi:hypothetical protein
VQEIEDPNYDYLLFLLINLFTDLMVFNCFHGDTLVTMGNGFSAPIRTISPQTHVLSYDEEKQGHVRRPTSALLAQGEKACVELLFSDGRTVVCTPDHRFLVAADGPLAERWVEARDMVVGEDAGTCIVAGMEYPTLIEPVQQDTEWSFDVSKYLGYSLNVTDKREHAIAFAGVIGYLVTDGSLSNLKGALYLGHRLDAEWVCRDIHLLTGKQVAITPMNGLFMVTLPVELRAAITEGAEVFVGERKSSITRFPAFLMQDTCPAVVIQAFLGSFFGGDGKAPSLTWKKNRVANIGSLSVSTSRLGRVYHEQRAAMTADLQHLFARLGMGHEAFAGISANHQVTNLTEKGRAEVKRRKALGLPLSQSAEQNLDPDLCYSIVWRLSLDFTLAFATKIGFRHCCHKQMRLTAASAYYRMRSTLERQKQFLNQFLATREAQLGCAFNSSVQVLQELGRAKAELAERECVHPIISKWEPPAGRRSKCFQGARTLGPAIGEVLLGIDALKFFSGPRKGKRYKAGQKRKHEEIEPVGPVEVIAPVIVEPEEIVDRMVYATAAGTQVFPTFRVRLIGRRQAGVHATFDLTVPGTENFQACALTAHNCKLAINTSTTQRLALVTQMTKQIVAKRVQADAGKAAADRAEDQMAQYFPKLIIVVRDAQLALEDKEGKPITGNQYLERAWTSSEAPSSAANGEAAPSSAVSDSKADLRRCYVQRACITMPQPTNNSKLLNMVNAMPVSQLAPEFVKALEEFRTLAFKMLSPKRLEGVSINGASLVEYIRSALPAINDGTIPLVEDSVQAMSAKQGQQLHADALAQWQLEYHQMHVQQQSSIGTAKPMLFDPDIIEPHIQQGVDKLVATFVAQLFKNASSAQQEAKLRKELQAKATEICESNMRLVRGNTR